MYQQWDLLLSCSQTKRHVEARVQMQAHMETRGHKRKEEKQAYVRVRDEPSHRHCGRHGEGRCSISDADRYLLSCKWVTQRFDGGWMSVWTVHGSLGIEDVVVEKLADGMGEPAEARIAGPIRACLLIVFAEAMPTVPSAGLWIGLESPLLLRRSLSAYFRYARTDTRLSRR